MMVLKFKVKHIESALKNMNDIKGRLNNLEPIWESFARHELSMAQHRIEEEGPGWPATHYPANMHPMLYYTGQLYESLDPGSNDTIKVDNDEVSFGTDVPYAVYQQLGTRGMQVKSRGLKTGGGIAPRKFLYVSPEDEAWLEQAIKVYVSRGKTPSE